MWVDWVVMGVTVVLVPIIIPLLTRRKTTHITVDLLLHPLPLALGLPLLSPQLPSLPAHVAQQGILRPWTSLLSATLALVTVSYLIIPVLHKMHLTSLFEYLELRFNSRLLRRLSSLLSLTCLLLTTSTSLHLTSNFLGPRLGLPAWSVAAGLGLLSTLLTLCSGLGSLVWSGVWQFLVVVAGLTSIIVAGWRSGGVSEDLVTSDLPTAGAVSGGLVTSSLPTTGVTIGDPVTSGLTTDNFTWASWSLDPRDSSSSFWMFLGHVITWSWWSGCHQPVVQRICSTSSLTKARLGLGLGLGSIWLVHCLTCGAGLVLAGVGGQGENLLRITDQMPGLGGLYFSALASATVALNMATVHSMATLVWEDFLSHTSLVQTAGETTRQTIARIILTLLGLVSCLMACLVSVTVSEDTVGTSSSVKYNISSSVTDNISSSVTNNSTQSVTKSITYSLTHNILHLMTETPIFILSGPALAIFLMGLLLPFTNKMGVLSGLVVGLALSVWLSVGSVWPGDRECRVLDFLYSLSWDVFPLLGMVVTLVVTVAVSLVTRLVGGPGRGPPHLLLHPLVRGDGVIGGHGSQLSYDANTWCREPESEGCPHYRWPSPSLPPTLKKGPRPGVGQVYSGHRTRFAVNGYENSSFQDWGEGSRSVQPSRS